MPKTRKITPTRLAYPYDKLPQIYSYKKAISWMIQLGTVFLIANLLGGCNSFSRLAEVGDKPKLTTIENPIHTPSYKPISMPMPELKSAPPRSNSLWRSGSRAFFKDLRANRVGDIVTIVIDIDENAEMTNVTTRSRNNTENAGISNLFGYEQSITKFLPEALTPGNLVGTNSALSNRGSGTISRGEAIEVTVAAVITQVLPNGNLVVHGRQETRINHEVRELQIAGIIRPQDISNANSIGLSQIAEARVSYGGRGHISDVQAPRWGSQIIDIIMPF